MSYWLWTELRDLFETDDGSLPEVHVNFVGHQAVAEAFTLLRHRSHDVTRGGGQFWSITDSKTHPLDSVANAAALVVSGVSAPFHVVLRNIQLRETVLPDLGVFVFPYRIELDYRMGTAWGPAEVSAFFQLLLELATIDPSASVTLEAGVLPDVEAHFQNCWSRFIAETRLILS